MAKSTSILGKKRDSKKVRPSGEGPVSLSQKSFKLRNPMADQKLYPNGAGIAGDEGIYQFGGGVKVLDQKVVNGKKMYLVEGDTVEDKDDKSFFTAVKEYFPSLLGETIIDQIPYSPIALSINQFRKGLPFTAISELLKIPGGPKGDALVNFIQENPTGYDIKTFQEKTVPYTRLTKDAFLENSIISEIGKQIIQSGETKNSKWYNREFNLPSLLESAKSYNVDDNTFTKFIEDNWESSGKNYKKILELADKHFNKVDYPQKPTQTSTGTYFNPHKKGGVIKDNRGQWKYPGEVTQIDSPYITMQGVPYPVMGVSDEGDVKLMLPNRNYFFEGNSVIEYPLIAQGGRTIDVIQQKNKVTPYSEKQLQDYRDFISNYSISSNPTLEQNEISPEIYGQEGKYCINGVCSIVNQAGLNFSNPQTSDKRYYSNIDFSDAVKGDKEDWYKLSNYGISDYQSGDLIQFKTGDSKVPSHMGILKKLPDGNFMMIDNGGGTKWREQIFEKESLDNLVNSDRIQIMRPGYNIDYDKLMIEKDKLKAKQLNYNLNYTDELNTYYNQNKEDEFINPIAQKINDENYLSDIAKSYNISKNDAQKIIKYTYGIIKQESGFKPKSLGTGDFGIEGPIEYFLAKFRTDRDLDKKYDYDPSSGYAQVRFNNLTADQKVKYNIRTPMDLYDYNKSQALLEDIIAKNYKYVLNNFDKIKSTHPSLTKENALEFALYMQNTPSMVMSPKYFEKVLTKSIENGYIDKEDIASEKDISVKGKTKEEVKKILQLNLDKGSYPDKVIKYSNEVFQPFKIAKEEPKTKKEFGGKIKMQGGGSVPTLYVSDPNDPRLKSYQDSLNLFITGKLDPLDKSKPLASESLLSNNKKTIVKKVPYDEMVNDPIKTYGMQSGVDKPLHSFEITDNYSTKTKNELFAKDLIKPEYFADYQTHYPTEIVHQYVPKYKKPVQPVEYRKKETETYLQPKGLTKVESSKSKVELPKDKSQGDYIINTQNSIFRVPNKAMFDAITRLGYPSRSWTTDATKTGGATFNMSDETLKSYLKDYFGALEKIGDAKTGVKKKQGGKIKAQQGVLIRNADGTTTEYDTSSDEYRKLYESGQIGAYDEATNSFYPSGTLPEVTITAQRPKSFQDFFRRYNEQLGKDIGSDISAGSFLQAMTQPILQLPQAAVTYALDPKSNVLPSKALGISEEKHPYWSMLINGVADPVNLFGAGLLDDALKINTKAGKFLTTKTPLRDAYKINPNLENPFGFRNVGDKPHWWKGYTNEVRPETIDLEAGFKEFKETVNKYAKSIELETKRKKLGKDHYNTETEKLENYLREKTPLDQLLGEGVYGRAYTFRNHPEAVLKFGKPGLGVEWTPEKIKAAEPFLKFGNIAIPKKVAYFETPSLNKYYGPSRYEVSLMDNLNNVKVDKLNLSEKNQRAYLLRQVRKLRDAGIEVDSYNRDNFKFNPDKGVYDIYDLNPSHSSINPYYMPFVSDKLNNHFGNFIFKLKHGGTIHPSRVINGKREFLVDEFEDGGEVQGGAHLPIVQKANDKAMAFSKRYVQSPNYINLLQSQGYNPEEISRRQNAVLDLSGSDINYNNFGQSWVSYDKINYNIHDKGNWPNWDDIAAHEWGHVGIASGEGYKLKDNERYQLAKRLNPDGLSPDGEARLHDENAHENRADLQWLRQQLQEEGIYDSFKGGKFKKEMLDKLKKSGKWNRIFRLYKDDDIEYLMNNIAQVPTLPGIQQSRYGGTVKVLQEKTVNGKKQYLIDDGK